ncbi:MAG: UPF0182 family protein [Anaerofustis stercorihominis]|nr:UPF0182 family protein [Anaerofustis stercorihominis]
MQRPPIDMFAHKKKTAKTVKREPKPINKFLWILLAVVAVVGILLGTCSNIYVDIMWYSEMGYLSVYFKELITKIIMSIPQFIVLAVLLSIYFRTLAKAKKGDDDEKKAPEVKAEVINEETAEENFAQDEKPVDEVKKDGPVIKKGKFVYTWLPLILAGIIAAVVSFDSTATLWNEWLEFMNSQPFNEFDPIFGKDISFYVFRLPFLRGLVNELYLLLLMIFGGTFLYSFVLLIDKSEVERSLENLSVDPDEAKGIIKKIAEAMRVQLSVFVALFMIVAAFGMYLSRFEVLQSSAGIFYGASYTDVKILLPLKNITIILLVLSAGSVLLFGFKKKIKPVFIMAALLAGVTLIGNIGAWAVEGYVVEPNQYSKEEEYINHSINYTQKAFGLDDVETVEITLDEKMTASDIKENMTTINNIPINDYRPTLDTYNSIQSMRSYYVFNDVDIDRYMVDGEYTEVFISARELDTDLLADSAQNWINKHLKYTHGMGVAVSSVNAVNSTGQPELIAQDIPTVTEFETLDIDQGRIYFGESTDEYSVVNTKAMEFDYPSGNSNIENVYDGEAGIKMNLLNRIVFSIKYGTTKFLFSSDITSDSKILLNRNIESRVMSIAPFLSYDADPYIVTVDGKLYWIMDAMTTTDKYPYSTPYTEYDFNYIRNSVKVVVDAYDGDVTFYIIDKNDPIAAAYASIYPALFKPIEEMPAGLVEHLRYSETLFTIQADVYQNYHMEDTGVFYNKEDVWEIATQFYETSKDIQVNPTYLIMKRPYEEKEEFMLMIPYTPKSKDNMVAWMAGLCDGENYGKLVVYQYPKQTLVYGPMQIEQRIDQDTTISPQLTLLGQQGSQVLRGNMQAILIDNDILYVEVVYVQAAGGEQALPEVKKVIVSYEDTIVMADDLISGIEMIFGDLDGEDKPQTPSDKPSTPGYVPSGDGLESQALDLFNKAEQAIARGDWAAYGQYLDQLGDVLNRMNTAPSQNTTPSVDSAE